MITKTANATKVNLHGAAFLLDAKKIAEAIDSGISINSTTTRGFTALHIVSEYGRMWISEKDKSAEAAEMLIRRGADVNFRALGGDTPLHVAVIFKNFKVAKLLLENNADPNIQNKLGNTPLHVANMVFSEMDDAFKEDFIGLLLANRADQGIKNNAGKSSLDLMQTGSLNGLLRTLANQMSVVGVSAPSLDIGTVRF